MCQNKQWDCDNETDYRCAVREGDEDLGFQDICEECKFELPRNGYEVKQKGIIF